MERGRTCTIETLALFLGLVGIAGREDPIRVGDGGCWRRLGKGELVSKLLDCAKYPHSISDAGNAHLLEGRIIELEKDIPPDVMGDEQVRVAATTMLMQPAADFGVVPCFEIGCKGHWLAGEGGVARGRMRGMVAGFRGG
jgi:hypothetical protein